MEEEQGKNDPSSSKMDKIKEKLNPNQKSEKTALEMLLKNNHSLDSSNVSKKTIEDLMKGLSTDTLMTGMTPTGKNNKDMADHKFWSTQPVSRFDEEVEQEGPIKPSGDAPTEPTPLLGDFEWVTMNLENREELKEVYELLSMNYVEDNDASFRFDYSASFLNWSLQAPGFTRDGHVGVRVKASKRLVAFISSIPIRLSLRKREVLVREVNFLCVHKKLRSKRLAPTLIKEIIRRAHLNGVWQGLYTAGVVLPKPFTACRYYHRTLDWSKLHEIGFTGLPPRSTKARQITKYKLPSQTSIPGLRLMTKSDVSSVADLLRRTLSTFDIHQMFSNAEVAHWLLSNPALPDSERVIWTYVVEKDKKVTDFFSFYSLPSTVVKPSKHQKLQAAYLFYYGTETKFGPLEIYEARLKELINDALILAKNLDFDVFNALTLLDNPSFLESCKFGPGDGYLNFYLWNYKFKPVNGGFLENGQLDGHTSGVGIVML